MNDLPSSPALRVSAQSDPPGKEPLGLLDSEPPPEVYGVDDVALLARDPFTLFAHWELTSAGRAAARAMLGEDGALALRLYVIADRHAPADVIDHLLDWDHGRRYLAAPRQGAHIAAALGLRGQDGRFAAVAAAPRIKVPYAEPGAAEELEWVDVAPPKTRGARLEPPILGGRVRTAAQPTGDQNPIHHEDLTSSPYR